MRFVNDYLLYCSCIANTTILYSNTKKKVKKILSSSDLHTPFFSKRTANKLLSLQNRNEIKISVGMIL